MTSGIIPYTSVPGWPAPPTGLFEACESAVGSSGFVSRVSNGVMVSDVAAVNAVLTSYSGGASELAYAKSQKQAALDAFFDANFDLKGFIRGGNATGVTGAGVGNFLAQITNNYRTLRASIAAGTTVAQVNAVVVTGGWPANP